MAAAALPLALLLGLVAELISGLLSWPLGGDRAWWRRVSNLGSDASRLYRDRQGRERVSVIQAGGAAAAMLGAGTAAAGALGVGPGDLPLLYLSLVVASAGTMVVAAGGELRDGRAGGRPLAAALAEPAFAVALGAMFLRYGALDLEAVRGTQQVLGTGLLLAPGLAAAGLAVAAVSLVGAAALRVPPSPDLQGRGRASARRAGPSLLARLCRWSVSGATALVAGVLLAGGGLEPLTVRSMVPAALGALGAAMAIGAFDALLARTSERWRMAAPAIALLLAGAGAAMVVLA